MPPSTFDVSRSNGGLKISGWIGQLSCLTICDKAVVVHSKLSLTWWWLKNNSWEIQNSPFSSVILPILRETQGTLLENKTRNLAIANMSRSASYNSSSNRVRNNCSHMMSDCGNWICTDNETIFTQGHGLDFLFETGKVDYTYLIAKITVKANQDHWQWHTINSISGL